MATEVAPDDTQAQNPVMVEQNRSSDIVDPKPRPQDPHPKAKDGAVEKSPITSSSARGNRGGSTAKVRKRTKTGCLSELALLALMSCEARLQLFQHVVAGASSAVKSGQYPLGAYRGPGGTARDSGIQFQPITSYHEVEAQQRLLQPRSSGQMPPPVIASQPMQNASELWTGMTQPVRTPMYHDASPMRPATFEGPMYTRGDLPPRMLQHMAQPGCSLDANPVAPERDSLGNRAIGVLSQHHGAHPSDPNSGIDITYPGLPSEWSHGSVSTATGPLNLDYVAESHETPLPNEGQVPDFSQPYTEMPYPADSCPPPTAWQHAETNPGAGQDWSSHLPPNVPDRYGPIGGYSTGETAQTAVNYGSSGYQPSDGNYASADTTSQISGNPHPMKETNHYDPTLPADYDPAMEDPDDDFYDVTSDEEDASGELIMSDATASHLGLMLAPAASFRSLTNFLNEPNVLSSYRPSYTASPLMDPETARVFCHYVTATAPTLSIHNRHTVNPSVRMFMGEPVPAYQRSLFTYTLPMMALSNQGLLHAQLALASLHIAKLQQTPPTPSLKHYHYALRRVAKAVGHPTKRREIATLAATLLLGFYEVTTAEHNKWNSHLAGARELILEIDFAGMTKRINAYKAETKATAKGYMYDYRQVQYDRGQRRMSFDILRTDKDVDETLINIMTGYKTKFDEYGRVIDPSEPTSHYLNPLTPKEVENFEIQCDLYWWYAKQDMYQSLISGNRLLLDHLVLLFARLTDWAARDRGRKVKVQKKAEQDMNMLMSQQSPRWTPNRGQNPAAQPPPMYGMVPAPPHVHLPSGFDQSRQDHHEANQIILQDAELEEATHAAEREWADICAALDILEEALGPDFQPLSSDLMPPLSTPFGPAIYHRTYSIACIWSLLITARIYATRVAPAMPPAAMVAAGVAAPATAHWANIIGRITGGLQPISSTAPLNPSHGAALMDSSMSLFHAGVQFRDAAQRGWTITKLRNVARMTGWQTSALIASGCERAWMAAAEMGKGPPYTRTMNATAKDDRVSGRSRDPNLGPPKDNNDRRFITMNPGTRVYWALGILGAEEDMEQLKLD
ncbi:MAG: hypothetical protein LQ350_000888 [Teloschistes chrysophthalmus]|nr:MAG: hypothetical protein LQ350_000888 [Niorma chrysophthalma]